MNYVLICKIFQEHFEYNSYSQVCFGIKLQLSSYVYLVLIFLINYSMTQKINLKKKAYSLG